MKSQGLVFASWMVLTGLAGYASAVGSADAPATIAPAFRVEFEPEDKFRHLAFGNYSTATGQEIIGLSFGCTYSPPDGNGFVTKTAKTRLIVRSATGGPNLFNITPSVTSLPMPNPFDDNNQCGGGNQTIFDEGDFPNTEQEGCPRDPGDPFPMNGLNSWELGAGDACEDGGVGGHFNVGMATGGSSARYLVFSDAITGEYRNAATGNENVDFTNFAIHVYNMNGTRAWTKSFPFLNSTGRLEPVLAGVGDFLNGDGEDELRIARIGDSETSAVFRYYYYDIDTGVLIAGPVAVTVTNP